MILEQLCHDQSMLRFGSYEATLKVTPKVTLKVTLKATLKATFKQLLDLTIKPTLFQLK